MKKILFSLFFTALIGGVLLTSSCTKQYNEVVPNQTSFIDQVATTDWTTADGGKTFTYTLPPKGFDLNGGILLYLSFDGEKTYEQIPEVYQGYSYSYVYTANSLTIYAQAANGTDIITAPDALAIKIVEIASN